MKKSKDLQDRQCCLNKKQQPNSRLKRFAGILVPKADENWLLYK